MKIAYLNEQGNISVVTPDPNMFDINSRTRKDLSSNGYDFTSKDQILQYIIDKDVPKDTEYHIIEDDNDLPDRYFRKAWKLEEEKETVLGIDTDKAKDIHADNLRELRKPLLANLDIEYMQAIETDDKDKQQEIIGKKQELRDVTNDLPDDLTELKEYIPACLTVDNK